MRYIDEFNDPGLARRLLDEIHATVTRPWALMEVCGGQTHSIIRHGIDQLPPQEVELIHGPGCPVCVTLAGTDRQGAGDRVPARGRPSARSVTCCGCRAPAGTCLRVKGEGGTSGCVLMDALELAGRHP